MELLHQSETVHVPIVARLAVGVQIEQFDGASGHRDGTAVRRDRGGQDVLRADQFVEHAVQLLVKVVTETAMGSHRRPRRIVTEWDCWWSDSSIKVRS